MICKHGADEGEEYSLCGSFRNLLLPMTYESIDKNKSDRGTITLKSSHNGQRLVGEIAMYETRSDSIDTAQVIWFRNKDDLEKTVVYIKKNREKLKKIREKENEIREELSEFMAEFAKEFAKRKRQEQEDKNNAIDGEAMHIANKED